MVLSCERLIGSIIEANNHDLFPVFNVCHESLDTVRDMGPHRAGASVCVQRHPSRPLSSAFEQDTRAYVKHNRYEPSLDLWRMPSTRNQCPATGVDLWSLMIGMDF